LEHQTDPVVVSCGGGWGVQLIPLLEVYIAEKVSPTSTNNEISGDQTISCKAIEGELTTTSQSIPLDEVVIL
jgi:hypothetical protein